jgi:phosphoribosylanthranilate isomerase
VSAAGVAPGWPTARAAPYVKICGLTTPALAEAAVAAGADMVGLVHFARSPRHVDLAAAAAIADAARGTRRSHASAPALADPTALVVVLTVDADDAALAAIVAAARPDALQLHGRETPERVAAVAARFGLPVARAFGIAEAADLAPAAATTALPVLDAKPPRGADRPGGHGTAFDWSVLAGFDRPYMLSGGLTPDTVADAVARLRPYAVDVSSGVEAGGAKDPAKVGAFVAAAR